MAEYFLVPRARDDLHEILETIAEDSPEAAMTVLEQFEKTFGLLAENPEMGHRRSDLTRLPVRFFPVYSYLVIYMDLCTPLRIVRVLSGCRDVQKVLEELT